MNVSHQKIADAVGLSRSTVSRAMRGDPRIPESTRCRIRQTASAMGYRPNPLISTLMSKVRSGKDLAFRGHIAVITDREEPNHWFDFRPSWRFMHQGAIDRAQKLGYGLENFSTRDFDAKGRRLSQILHARGILGIFIAPGFVDRNVALDWSRFAAATTGYSLISPTLNRACYDHFHGLQLALGKLVQMGFQRIGLFLEKRHDEATDHHYCASFLLYQRNLAPAHRVPIEVSGGAEKDDFMKWFRQHRPQVVLARREDVVDWAAEMGVRCPKEFGFVHLDWRPDLKAFCGINHNWELIGSTAIDLITSQISQSEFGIPEDPITTVVRGKWVDGPSLAPQTGT